MKAIPILLAAVLLTACQTRPADEAYRFQSMGEDGEIVLTGDWKALSEKGVEAPAMLSAVADRVNRISLAMQPTAESYPLALDQWDFYGFIEGRFPKFLTNMVIGKTEGFEKVRENGLKYYAGPELSMAAVKKNLIFFTTGSYDEAYQKAFDPELQIANEEAALMASSPMAVYSRNPKTLVDIGIELSESAIKSISSCLLLIDEADGHTVLSGCIECQDKSALRALSTALKNELIKKAKKSGEKLDLKALAAIVSTKDLIVSIDKLPLSSSLAENARKLMAAGGVV